MAINKNISACEVTPKAESRLFDMILLTLEVCEQLNQPVEASPEVSFAVNDQLLQ